MAATKEIRRPIGLPNTGNSCYLNALLQILFLIEPIRNGYLDRVWQVSMSTVGDDDGDSTGLPEYIISEYLSTGAFSFTKRRDGGRRLQNFINSFHVSVSDIFHVIVAASSTTDSSKVITSGESLSKLLALRRTTHGTDVIGETLTTQESLIEVLGRLLHSFADDRLVVVDPFYEKIYRKNLDIVYMNNTSGQKCTVPWIILAVTESLGDRWSLQRLLDEKPRDCFELMLGFDSIISTSDHILIALERGMVSVSGASKKQCDFPKILFIKDTDEIFYLRGAVYRPSETIYGHYIVKAQYGVQWFWIDDISVIPFGKEQQEFESTFVELLIYKKCL